MSVDLPLSQRSAASVPARHGPHPALVFGIVGVTLAIWFTWVIATALDTGGRYDFESYYLAATALRLDPHANLYANAVLAHAADVAGGLPYHPLPYTYPPLLAILLVPLSLLPFAVAAACWFILNAALWLACAFLLADEVRHLLTRSADGSPSREVTLVALGVTLPLCLLSWPAGSSLLLGQVGISVLVPLVLVPRLLRQGRDGWAGAAIALAAMLKFTPLLLLGYLVLTRRWRALRYALIALAVLIILCVAVVGPGVALQAVPQALRVGSEDSTHANNQAIFGVLAVALHATAPALDTALRLLQYVVLLSIAVATALLLARAKPLEPAGGASVPGHRWSGHDAAAFALALCALPLVSPVAWSHHYVWLLPANAFLLANALNCWRGASSERERTAAARQLGLLVLATLLINIAAAYAVQQALKLVSPLFLGMPLSVWTNEMPAIGTLLLFGIAAFQLRTAPRIQLYSKRTKRAVES